MLNQVVLPDAARSGVGFELPHGVKLVVAGKNHRLFADFPSTDFLLFNLEMDEASQNVEQGVSLPDLLPKVGGLVAVRVFRIASTGSVAKIERQEERLLAAQPRFLESQRNDANERAP